jgi:hypothetical protein
MKTTLSLRAVLLSLLLALSASAAYARDPGQCPASDQPLPTAEQRQFIVPVKLLHCFLSPADIATASSSIGHDAQTTVTDPAFESGELNPDGSLRPPLTAGQFAALAKMHAVLNEDMHEGAVIRKFIANSDIGGFLYGRTVIGSPTSPIVVTTDTVRGFIGLERNTQGLDAGEAVGALGLDYESTPTGQFTDASPLPFHRQVAMEVIVHGLHSIRHHMSAQGAADAQIPMARDLNNSVDASTPSLDDHHFEMDRQGQTNPYTGLGISDNIGLLTLSPDDAPDAVYPLHLNEEEVMTVPTPLISGDEIFRRTIDGEETLIARYVKITHANGTVIHRWDLSRHLSAADRAYYEGLIQQAAAQVAAAGG